MISVTFGESLAITGLSDRVLHRRDHLEAAASGSVPNAIPPCRTFRTGNIHLDPPDLIAKIQPLRHLRIFFTENPPMLAMTFLSKIVARSGRFLFDHFSTPGFCRPMELIRPTSHSAIRGVGFPNRRLQSRSLKRKTPQAVDMHKAAANSRPYPKVPLAAIHRIVQRYSAKLRLQHIRLRLYHRISLLSSTGPSPDPAQPHTWFRRSTHTCSKSATHSLLKTHLTFKAFRQGFVQSFQHRLRPACIKECGRLLNVSQHICHKAFLPHAPVGCRHQHLSAQLLEFFLIKHLTLCIERPGSQSAVLPLLSSFCKVHTGEAHRRRLR